MASRTDWNARPRPFAFAHGLAAALLLCAAAVSAATPSMPQGGGTIYPAWSAEYFANPSLSGSAAYTRSEIRVRFDWETWRPILGVRAESLRSFPTDGFSARFTGRLVSRFAETYRFRLVSDEGARLYIRPEGATAWTTLIDAWAGHARRSDQADYALDPALRYEVRLEYYDLTGDAACILYWSSPSTPEEVIDYATGSSTRSYQPEMYADQNAQGADSGTFPSESGSMGGKFPVDASGWPTSDFSYSLQNGYSSYGGRFLLSFQGQAQIRLGAGNFLVSGSSYGSTLPKGVGYDAATNRTLAQVDIPGDLVKPTITGTLTQRSPGGANNTGITELHLMKPTRLGSGVAHEVGEVICGEAREAFLPFGIFRIQSTGLNNIVRWPERTLPTYSRIFGQYWKNDGAYELLMIAANELGRDLHLCFGGSIDYEFMDKLARLARYGSDGVEPYAGPTANPVYPPLNPNLRLYLEHGNEMGWSGIQPTAWHDDYQLIRNAAQQPEWGAINFDGLAAGDYYRGLYRYHAYRTVRMSQAMRQVWGDAAMGDQIRVFLFGQYEVHYQNTTCQFIDDYFNNGAGSFVPDPRPVSAHLWGAGPAVYYSTTNPWAESGTTPQTDLADRSFEGTTLAPGTAQLRPSHPSWRFTGGAGLVDLRYPRQLGAASVVPGTVRSATAAMAAGFQFTVGPQDLYVYEVGRRALAGNNASHSVAIYQISGSTATGLGSGSAPSVAMSGSAANTTVFQPLRYSGWATSDSHRVGLYRLLAGGTYAILSQEQAGGDTFLDSDSALAAGPGLTINGGAMAAVSSLNGKGTLAAPVQLVGGSGTGFGHVNFRYTNQILDPGGNGMVVVPPDPYIDTRITDGIYGKATIPAEVQSGTMMAFIAGSGAIEQDVTITEAGDYALIFTGACGHTGDNRLDITIGGQPVWTNLLMGTSRKPKNGVFQWGTEYLPLAPGTYTVRIQTTGSNPAAVVYLDGMHLGSMDSYFGGPDAENFLGAGTATGQTDGKYFVIAEHCPSMAQNWGLVGSTYEGGTNPGGDWNGENVLYATQAKWDHPYSYVADNNAARIWHSFGGFNFSYYYPAFQDSQIAVPENHQPWLAARDRAMGWELEPTNGLPFPSTLTCADAHYEGSTASTYSGFDHKFTSDGFDANPTLSARQWKSWIVLVGTAGNYAVSAETTAGGTARLAVDDANVLATGTSGGTLGGQLFLTRGIHAIKVRCESGGFSVVQITGSSAVPPPPPPPEALPLQDPGSAGLLVVEAEDYASIQSGTGSYAGLSWVEQTDSGASNGALMVVSSTGRIATSNITDAPQFGFTARFVRTGTHYLWIRSREGSSPGGDNSCTPAWEGALLDQWHLSTGTTWHWARHPAAIAVASGTRAFAIHMREDGTRIDKILFTASAAYDPTSAGSLGPPPSPVTGDPSAIGYAQWAGTHQWAGRDAGETADPDLDRIANRLEWRLARDPILPDALFSRTDILPGQGGDDALVLEFRRRTGSGQPRTETSADLTTWADRVPDGNTLVEQILDPDVFGDGTAEHVRLTIRPEQPSGRLFFRFADP